MIKFNFTWSLYKQGKVRYIPMDKIKEEAQKLAPAWYQKGEDYYNGQNGVKINYAPC